MKRILLFFILFSNQLNLFGHEDTYKSFQLSNLHLMISVGFEESYQLKIANTYAPLINEFIADIDKSQFVFLQFSESYCSSEESNSPIFLSIDSFRTYLTPGFPWAMDYDLGMVENGFGLNIYLTGDTNFRLKKLLKLIEFGLTNNQFVLRNQTELGKFSPYLDPSTGEYFPWGLKDGFMTVDSTIIDSVLRNETQSISIFMQKELILEHSDPNLNNIQITLVNDSLQIRDSIGKTYLTISSIQEIESHLQTNSLFVFNTDTSFYFIDLIKNETLFFKDLGFSIKHICQNWPQIDYQPDLKQYSIKKGSLSRYEEQQLFEFKRK